MRTAGLRCQTRSDERELRRVRITSVALEGGGGGRSEERTSTASSSVSTRPDSWPDPAWSGPTVERDAGGSGGASRVSGGTPSLLLRSASQRCSSVWPTGRKATRMTCSTSTSISSAFW